jgi:ribosomal protein L4
MEVNVLNMAGEKVRTVNLPPEIFEAPINVDLMHQAYQFARWPMHAWVRIVPRHAPK